MHSRISSNLRACLTFQTCRIRKAIGSSSRKSGKRRRYQRCMRSWNLSCFEESRPTWRPYYRKSGSTFYMHRWPRSRKNFIARSKTMTSEHTLRKKRWRDLTAIRQIMERFVQSTASNEERRADIYRRTRVPSHPERLRQQAEGGPGGKAGKRKRTPRSVTENIFKTWTEAIPAKKLTKRSCRSKNGSKTFLWLVSSVSPLAIVY